MHEHLFVRVQSVIQLDIEMTHDYHNSHEILSIDVVDFILLLLLFFHH